MKTTLFLILCAAALIAFLIGRARGKAFAAARRGIVHSRPQYHGGFLALATFLPAAAALALLGSVGPSLVDSLARAQMPADILAGPALEVTKRMSDIRAIAQGQTPSGTTQALRDAAEIYAGYDRGFDLATVAIVAGLAALGFGLAYRRLSPAFRARTMVERATMGFLFAASGVAVLTTFGILLSVVFETFRFLSIVSPIDFFFGTHWSPQQATPGNEAGAFGLIPLLTGSILITALAMLVAGPVGLFAAIYMSEYATPATRAIAKPVLEVLAGIPTVVFGFFAALTLGPLIRDIGGGLGLHVVTESALAAGLVMGVMIIPFVSSLADDVISAVPQAMRDGSYGMGATKSETIKRVVIPAALPGIASAMMLAISRAIGETMIVVMAAGLAANLTLNPLDAVTTITVQIKTLLVGDQEFDSAKTLSAFAIGFVLFFFTLALNVVALRIVRRYREQVE